MPFGRYKSDVETGIDVPRMQQYRRDRARKILNERGIDALLAFNPDNIRYLTIGPSDAWVKEVGNRFVLFPVDGESILFDTGMMEPAFSMEFPDIDIRPLIPVMGWYLYGLTVMPGALEHQTNKWIAQVADALAEKGLKGKKVALDYNLPREFRDGLTGQGGVVLTDEGMPAMMQARAIKCQDEIECLRMAATIVEACFHAMKKEIRPGATENDIMAVIHEAAFRNGAEALTCHVAAGRHTWPNRCWHGDHMIRPGDVVFADVYALSFLGYRSCYYRAFSCGEPSKAQRETHTRVRDMLYAAFDIIKPGVTTRDIALLWPKAEEFGHVSEDAAVMMQWGHGLGLALYEQPYISRIWSVDFPETLEVGMTFALETIASTGETTVEMPHGQSIRLEDMIAVTETGIDRLTRWPLDEIEVCPL
ncbi:MAG: aminopeptidase P family protein [Chloroflexi bacterium]|nr:aminopeptidase P family protein [Chloroflexota bacterium]